MVKIVIVYLLVLLVCYGCDESRSDRRYSNIRSYGNNAQNNSYGQSQSGNASLYSSQYRYSNTTVSRPSLNSSGYKYNYKVGSTYNYDVSGYDDEGNAVTGNVDIDRDGEGYIIDEDGNEKSINVEWTGYGEMEGYDEDGNYYELEVD